MQNFVWMLHAHQACIWLRHNYSWSIKCESLRVVYFSRRKVNHISFAFTTPKVACLVTFVELGFKRRVSDRFRGAAHLTQQLFQAPNVSNDVALENAIGRHRAYLGERGFGKKGKQTTTPRSHASSNSCALQAQSISSDVPVLVRFFISWGENIGKGWLAVSLACEVGYFLNGHKLLTRRWTRRVGKTSTELSCALAHLLLIIFQEYRSRQSVEST